MPGQKSVTLEKYLNFWINLEPVPKGRARFTRSGRCYTPIKTRIFERSLRILAKRYALKEPPHCGLRLEICFYLKRSAARKKDLEHTIKPDLDNLVKAVKDSFNDLFWKDDAQVHTMLVRKMFASETPKMHISITYDDNLSYQKIVRKKK